MYETVKDYMLEHNMNIFDMDDIQDAFVEVYMNDYHFTDPELVILASEFKNWNHNDS